MSLFFDLVRAIKFWGNYPIARADTDSLILSATMKIIDQMQIS